MNKKFIAVVALLLGAGEASANYFGYRSFVYRCSDGRKYHAVFAFWRHAQSSTVRYAMKYFCASGTLTKNTYVSTYQPHPEIHGCINDSDPSSHYCFDEFSLRNKLSFKNKVEINHGPCRGSSCQLRTARKRFPASVKKHPSRSWLKRAQRPYQVWMKQKVTGPK